MARLIDTSVFIQLERHGHPLEVAVSDALSELHAIASVTVAELLYGVERADTPARRRRRRAFVENVLEIVPVVPLDVGVARAQAQLWAKLESTGRRIGPYDLIVAATALAKRYQVLTFNVKEFERVPGLVTVRPGW